ncbi:MAG: hypothetical protein IJ845_09215 [Bacteroidaceae bacterium]|nr:hypothetical protein [Bacteroidaceae bacterium]
MKNSFFIILCMCLLAGCSETLADKPVYGFEKKVKLKGHNWGISESLNRTNGIFMAGSNYMLVSDENGETLFGLIDLQDHSKIYRFGVQGQGPKEVLSKFPFITSDKDIKLYDSNKQRLVQFDIPNILQGETGVTDVIFKSEEEGYFSRLIDFPECDVMIGTGIYDKGRFCLISRDGRVLSYAEDYPMENEGAELPSWVLFSAYQGAMDRQPTGNRFAVVTLTGELMQVYELDYNTKQLKQIKFNCNSYPHFSTYGEGEDVNYMPNRRTKWGYEGMYVTDKYIYALYSGKPYYDSNNQLNSGADKVHVFDWDGNPVVCLNLDREARIITGTDDTLYAKIVLSDGGYEIREYKLDFNR